MQRAGITKIQVGVVLLIGLLTFFRGVFHFLLPENSLQITSIGTISGADSILFLFSVIGACQIIFGSLYLYFSIFA